MSFGIDFGTSNSVVARWDGLNGEVLAVDAKNLPAQWRATKEFEQLFPSVLSVRDLQRTLCFGWEAKTSTGSPVDAVKRMLGTASAAGTADLEDSTPSLGEHEVYLANQPFPSTAAAGALFSHMRVGVSEHLLSLDEAVVTVPANATGGARYRTRAAAMLAGIKVKALINEPTAAAISYAHRISDPGKLLVFDWGGGTIDVTVLEYSKGLIEEKASRGIAALGGLEFDEALARLILGKIGQVPEGLTAAERRRWRRDVELTKIALSRPEADTVLFDVPGLREPVRVTRDEYEAAVLPLIHRALQPVRQCLDDLRISPTELDAVLMIGGTSQIPRVRKELTSVLGHDAIVSPGLCPPMTAVARGASILAAKIDGKVETEIALVTNYDLGVPVTAGPTRGFRAIIPRNSTLIAEREATFVPSKAFASSVNVEVLEGEASYSADSDRAFPLAKLQVPLRSRQADPEANQIRIKFRYDLNGILKIVARLASNDELLLEQEIDSFGPYGNPVSAGLERDFKRLLERIITPFSEPGTSPPKRPSDDDVPLATQPEHVPPPDVYINDLDPDSL